MVLRAWCERPSYGNGFSVILIPSQKTSAVGFREPLLIEPRIPSSHIRINQRVFGIGRDLSLDIRQQIAHILAACAWCETGYQRQGFGAAIHFPNGPLDKRSAEDLRAGAFSEQF